MKFTDNIGGITGQIIMDVFDRGNLIDHIDDHNLVVNSSREILSRLIGGTSIPITRFGIGTNGSSANVGNTVLTGIYTNSFSSVTYPSSNQVSFQFGVTESEAIGMVIQEFGLLTTAGLLFARKIKTKALTKTDSISFSGSWIVKFGE